MRQHEGDGVGGSGWSREVAAGVKGGSGGSRVVVAGQGRQWWVVKGSGGLLRAAAVVGH